MGGISPGERCGLRKYMSERLPSTRFPSLRSMCAWSVWRQGEIRVEAWGLRFEAERGPTGVSRQVNTGRKEKRARGVANPPDP